MSYDKCKEEQPLDSAKPERVEVWFPIEKDAEGFPKSRDWEGLWSTPVNDGFVVENVPFYLKNVSKGDLIAAEARDFLQFTEVLAHKGHNTYRLLMLEASENKVDEVISELEALGLTTELNETGTLLAVDVPPSVNQQQVDVYLLAGKEAGRWSMQDGYLNNIDIT
jgi:Domain of unknown function (DUF4265)